jgi:hypothetical protein
VRSFVWNGLPVAALLIASAGPAVAADPVCTPSGNGQLRCTIDAISDCEQVSDYPYARNLFCPAAFSAVSEMVSEVARTLGAEVPASGSFHFFQTIADSATEEAQTTTACLATPAPWDSNFVEGAGVPLCHLVAYATSPGPVVAGEPSDSPVPGSLRGYPAYFKSLYAPTPDFPLREFRSGSVFDPIVESLGAAGYAGFVADYPDFSPTELYDPDGWHADYEYRGLSGGGGGGWGGEIAVVSRRGDPVTLLAFGGGGGGGMTSFREGPTQVVTSLGAGGGGGMQFGNAYRVKSRNYGGLGLGAGVGSGEPSVQYSYNDYDGSGSPPQPVNEYNPDVIDEFTTQLANLGEELRARYERGKVVAVMGGGGMGGGTEYLMTNGQEYEPHALSTQAGFQFRYEFELPALRATGAAAGVFSGLQVEQQDFYELLGEDFRIANDQAFEECGRDYSNYACMCPRSHAIVICLAGEQLGDPDEIPTWLQEQHCPDERATRPRNGFSSYQQLLLSSIEPESPCARVLRDYFTRLNTPVAGLQELPDRARPRRGAGAR